MSKKIRVWLAVVFLVACIISLVMYFTKRSEHLYSEQVLETAANQFKKSLETFLLDVGHSVNQLQNDFAEWSTNDFTQDQLNHYLTAMIGETNSVFGAVIFRDDFNYIAFNEGASWVITFDTIFTDDITDWYRFDDKMNEISKWSDTYKYFVNEENIFNIREALQEEQIVWKFVGKRSIEREDLVFCIFPLTSQQGEDFAGAFAFRLNDLASPFRPILQFVQPYVNIISTTNDIMIPVRPSDTNLIRRITTLSPQIYDIIDIWKAKQDSVAGTYNFEQDNLSY